MDFVDGGEQVQGLYVGRADSLRDDSERLALLSIQVSEASAGILQRVARRIRQNIRCNDYVLLVENVCAIVLPGAAFPEAELASRRLSRLLVDIEYELQIVSGSAAQTLLGKLRHALAILIGKETDNADELFPLEPQSQEGDGLPYLAFLSSYPSRRLLRLFPYELACRYQCVPVGAERGMLTIATRRRLSFEIIAHFRDVTQRSIVQVRCDTSILNEVLRCWQQFDPLPEM